MATLQGVSVKVRDQFMSNIVFFVLVTNRLLYKKGQLKLETVYSNFMSSKVKDTSI